MHSSSDNGDQSTSTSERSDETDTPKGDDLVSPPPHSMKEESRRHSDQRSDDLGWFGNDDKSATATDSTSSSVLEVDEVEENRNESYDEDDSEEYLPRAGSTDASESRARSSGSEDSLDLLSPGKMRHYSRGSTSGLSEGVGKLSFTKIK